jgi:hypothetical protein
MRTLESGHAKGTLQWEVPSLSGYRPPRQAPPITESPWELASPLTHLNNTDP